MPSTRRGHLRRLGSVGGVLAGVLGGCTGTNGGAESLTTVRVGSKPFPEQRLLGYLAYHRLQHVDDVQVVDEIGYGNSRENWEATAAGVKDLYWEYTGTAWSRLPPRRERRVTDPDRLSELVRADARTQGLRMGSPASFSNEYVLVANRRWSERTGVTTLSELQAHVAAGNTDFGLAINEDFYHRRDAWRGLADHYDIDAERRAALESGPFVVTSVGITYELLREGRVQIASGFGTDPQLDRRSLVELADDRDYFLPYQPAPTAYAPTVERHPEIFEVLERIVSALDAPTVRRLNRRVLLDGDEASAVARSYLDGLGGNRA